MLRTLGPLLATCAVTMGILLAVTPSDEWWIAGIVGGVLLVSVGIAAWLLRLTRLDAGPDGIAYHAIGYRVAGAWADVTGYAERTSGMHTYEALILSRSGIEMSGWMSFAYRLMPLAQVVSALDGRYIPASLAGIEDAIPVGLFDHDWRSGELGSIVRSYAPGALDTKVA
jgi:hypothetical protein